eukprot:gnl/TRDRNA2_/TRDRNA2_196580_c0_seq1.p1 gnl/TRDRNA2_/TRDRNA2_196580_c0~~gnl/TRDRNA2_/TRDRNA2_196580_c0_seq1.p1  ORF type:complete len:265 (+),score=47.61 gnl/TRDRNA2_/TRDRNA2_196580_c0_seq1:51-797(+)
MVVQDLWSSNVQTVMMKNLPNRYSQQMLLEEIVKAGFLGSFDFLYLPLDPDTSVNRGYAFINFVDACEAQMFKAVFDGRKLSPNSSKCVSVMPATTQGFEANYAHYSRSLLNCSGGPFTKPLILREPSDFSLAHIGASKIREDKRSSGQRRQNKVDLSAKFKKEVAEAPQAPPAELVPATLIGHRDLWTENVTPSTKPAAGKNEDIRFDEIFAMVCPHCSGEIQHYFNFCRYCGMSLHATDKIFIATL